jgi:hypothetical protein
VIQTLLQERKVHLLEREAAEREELGVEGAKMAASIGGSKRLTTWKRSLKVTRTS